MNPKFKERIFLLHSITNYLLYICSIVLKIKHLFIVIYLFSISLKAQEKDKNALSDQYRNQTLISIAYARHMPLGTMTERFGSSNTLGIGCDYKFGRNWQVGGGLDVIFGSVVKENTMFDTITGASGSMIDAQGNLAVVRLYERGFHFHFDFGKVIPLDRMNLNSGLLISGGIGMIQHNIKFQFTRTIMPQLENGMYKGYDRLSNGFMLRGFIGYQRTEPDELLHFYIGLEYLKGFTQSRREYNYDTRTRDNAMRNDILFGFKVGLIIPLLGKQAGTKKGEEEKFYN